MKKLKNKFKLCVVECLYDDVGWDIRDVAYNKRELKEILKKTKDEFPKDRVRVRVYTPEA